MRSLATPSTETVIEELRDGFNRLRGRLFQAIEATGVEEGHQRAMKGLVRSTTYDMQGEIEGAARRALTEDHDA